MRKKTESNRQEIMCRWSAVERKDKSIGLKFAHETFIKKNPLVLPSLWDCAARAVPSMDFMDSIVGSVKPNSHRSSETWTARTDVVVILRNRDGITRGRDNEHSVQGIHRGKHRNLLQN